MQYTSLLITCIILISTVLNTVWSQCNPINDHCCAYPQFGQISCSFDRGRADVISRFPGRRARLPLNAWMYTEIYMGSSCVVEWDPPNIQDSFPRLKFFVWDQMCNKTCVPPPPIEGAVLMNVCIQDDTTDTTMIYDTTTTTQATDPPEPSILTPELSSNLEVLLGTEIEETRSGPGETINRQLFSINNDLVQEQTLNDQRQEEADLPCSDEWRSEACKQVINGSADTCLNEFIRNNCRRTCRLCTTALIADQLTSDTSSESCTDEMDPYLCQGLRPVHKCEDTKYVTVCRKTCDQCHLPVIVNEPVESTVFVTPSIQIRPTLQVQNESSQEQEEEEEEEEFDFDGDFDSDQLYDLAQNSEAASNKLEVTNCSAFLRNGVPLESYYPTPDVDNNTVGVFLCPPGETPTLFTCVNRKWTIGGHEAACGLPRFQAAPPQTQPRFNESKEQMEPEADNLIRVGSAVQQGAGKHRTLVEGTSFVTPNLQRFTRADLCHDRIESLSCALLTAHCHTAEVGNICALTCGLCVTSDLTVRSSTPITTTSPNFGPAAAPARPAVMQTPCEDSLPSNQCQANINFCNDPVFRIELCPATCQTCDTLNT